jgi:hypothetical protein
MELVPRPLLERRSWFDLVPPIALLVVTVAAWSIYAWVLWPFHWQSRLMHPLLFSLWTASWHTTVRGALARRLGLRLTLLPTLIVPPLAALGGEAIQGVWSAVGHEPEWGGACFSLLGVSIAWALIWLWKCLEPAPTPYAQPTIGRGR